MGAALPEGAGVSAAAGGVLSPPGAGLGEGSVPTSGVSSTGRAGVGVAAVWPPLPPELPEEILLTTSSSFRRRSSR